MKIFNSLQSELIKFSNLFHPITILAIVGFLNYYWTAILSSFETYFQSITAAALVDLFLAKEFTTNPSSQTVLSLIQTYNLESRTAYWVFFILDNIIPLIVFGSFSLLWIRILQFVKWDFFQGLLKTPFILIPLGVGFFDILENLYLIQVVSNPQIANSLDLLNIALVFNKIKAAFLLSSFLLTLVLIIIYFVYLITSFVSKKKAEKI